MGTRRWSELTPRERGVVIALATIQLSLLVAALIDLGRRPADQVRGGKGRWVLVSMVNTVGPITYFLAGRRRA